MRLLTIAAVFWFLADQLSKIAVLHWAGLLERGVIEVFPPFLVFILGYNTGINFGLMAGGPEVTRWILVGIALAISAWLCGGRAPG
jgi:signal peptidase II